MRRARLLAGLSVVSLLIAATAARADAQPTPAPATPETERTQVPADTEDDKGLQADDANDPTWFGMGFESRQERFRREQGVPGSAGGHGGNGGGGPGNGGGR